MFDPDFGSPLPRGLAVFGGGWRGPGSHAGIDIGVREGTPIFSIGDGVVIAASAAPAGDMGIFATVRHPSGIVSRYLHMSQLGVRPGDRVDKGDTLGLSGNTGLSTGPHLHIDLKVPAQETLAKIIEVAGTPSTGFEQNVTGMGIGVPGEPWIPADQYAPAVISGAKSMGVMLYPDRPKSLVPKIIFGALLLGGLYAGWKIAGAGGGGTGGQAP